jgi:hypothetical protein
MDRNPWARTPAILDGRKDGRKDGRFVFIVSWFRND